MDIYIQVQVGIFKFHSTKKDARYSGLVLFLVSTFYICLHGPFLLQSAEIYSK